MNTPSPILAREKDKGGSSQKSELISVLFALLLFNLFTNDIKICCCSSDISLLNGLINEFCWLSSQLSVHFWYLSSPLTPESHVMQEGAQGIGGRNAQKVEEFKSSLFSDTLI